MLFIVATPIGNLKDITLRALEILQTVDGIVCEDTRRSQILLNNYQIKKPLFILNDFNGSIEIPKILEVLKMGKNIALISDAGSPLISDPGYKLVRNCLENHITIDSLPGPSSIIPALTLSTLPPDKFMFLGYLPEKPGHRKSLLENINKSSKLIKATYIIFIAPHKIRKTLDEMLNIFGDIEIVLAKELTKIHQEVKKQTISVWLKTYKKTNPKGEFTLLFNL